MEESADLKATKDAEETAADLFVEEAEANTVSGDFSPKKRLRTILHEHTSCVSSLHVVWVAMGFTPAAVE